MMSFHDIFPTHFIWEYNNNLHIVILLNVEHKNVSFT